MACQRAFVAAAVALLPFGPALGQDAAGGGQTQAAEPIVLESMGNRPFGGVVVGDPATAALHCDHGYVDYRVPPDPREHPLVMVHASSKKTWETTFDGEDGFAPIFLRRGYAVHTTDLPRTGQAGQGCGATSYEPEIGNDRASFITWRLGLWPEGDAEPTFYDGVRFPVDDPEALDEFFRIQTPEFNAPENEQVETDALAVLLDEIGPSVVLTHSSTGIRGWITATKTDNVAAIVSYEPGGYVFPEDEAPEPIVRSDGQPTTGIYPIPVEDFEKLTRYPIQIVWGDYVPAEKHDIVSLDQRRIRLLYSRQMVEAINAHGGDAELLILPEIGVTGNTHFPMLDTNNVEIADLLSEFLDRKGIEKTDRVLN